MCEVAVMDALITTPKMVGGTWSVARSEGRHDADCECGRGWKVRLKQSHGVRCRIRKQYPKVIPRPGVLEGNSNRMPFWPSRKEASQR